MKLSYGYLKKKTFCSCSLALNGTEPGVRWVYGYVFFQWLGVPKDLTSSDSALKHLKRWGHGCQAVRARGPTKDTRVQWEWFIRYTTPAVGIKSFVLPFEWLCDVIQPN